MHLSKPFALLAAVSLGLAACSAPKPEPIRPAPVYNKFGGAGCVADDGRVVFPETVPGTAPLPPTYLAPCDEWCDEAPLYAADGSLIDPCLPEPRRPSPNDRNDSSDSSDPRDPTGRPAGT